eukprot:4784870-Lingulodinium_polyedra.AAC.1
MAVRFVQWDFALSSWAASPVPVGRQSHHTMYICARRIALTRNRHGRALEPYSKQTSTTH